MTTYLTLKHKADLLEKVQLGILQMQVSQVALFFFIFYVIMIPMSKTDKEKKAIWEEKPDERNHS